MSTKEYHTIKVRPGAYRALKVLAAKRGVSMMELIDRLAAQAERGDERGGAAADDTDRRTTTR